VKRTSGIKNLNAEFYKKTAPFCSPYVTYYCHIDFLKEFRPNIASSDLILYFSILSVSNKAFHFSLAFGRTEKKTKFDSVISSHEEGEEEYYAFRLPWVSGAVRRHFEGPIFFTTITSCNSTVPCRYVSSILTIQS
jgi:hypothetical protein